MPSLDEARPVRRTSVPMEPIPEASPRPSVEALQRSHSNALPDAPVVQPYVAPQVPAETSRPREATEPLPPYPGRGSTASVEPEPTTSRKLSRTQTEPITPVSRKPSAVEPAPESPASPDPSAAPAEPAQQQQAKTEPIAPVQRSTSLPPEDIKSPTRAPTRATTLPVEPATQPVSETQTPSRRASLLQRIRTGLRGESGPGTIEETNEKAKNAFEDAEDNAPTPPPRAITQPPPERAPTVKVPERSNSQGVV